MKLLWRVCGNAKRILAGVAVLLLIVVPSFGADDSRLFTTGFEAFSGGDSKKAARTLSHLLDAYPGTKLRELTLFYLARAHFRTGNQEEAAKAMQRLLQEYPGTSLAGKAEKDLLELVARYRKGEKLSRGDDDLDVLPVGELAAVSAVPESGTTRVAEEKAAREKADQERLAREQAEREQAARRKAEEERLAREKAERERLAREETERVRLVIEKEQAAREQAERERLAREQAERERLAREKAELTRLAMEKEKATRTKAPTRSTPTASRSVASAPGAGVELSGPLLRAVVKP